MSGYHGFVPYRAEDIARAVPAGVLMPFPRHRSFNKVMRDEVRINARKTKCPRCSSPTDRGFCKQCGDVVA